MSGETELMRENRVGFFAGFGVAVLVGGLALAIFSVTPSRALERAADEKDVLKACEKRLCDIVVNKQTAGDDLSCHLSKTWAKSNIKDGIEKRKLSWSFGDARCTVDLSAKRDLILGAMTKPEHALELAPHTVKCEIEREGEVTPINITLAPKVTFKNGTADKAWLNVKSIEAPAVVKGAIWTAAQIEDNFGLFQSDMIAEINEFVQKKCPKSLTSN
jgi:hypothetical protein